MSTFTKEDIKKIFDVPKTKDIVKENTLSSDGKNLLVRIPKEIVEYYKLSKGDKIKFTIKSDTKELEVKFNKNDSTFRPCSDCHGFNITRLFNSCGFHYTSSSINHSIRQLTFQFPG